MKINGCKVLWKIGVEDIAVDMRGGVESRENEKGLANEA